MVSFPSVENSESYSLHKANYQRRLRERKTESWKEFCTNNFNGDLFGAYYHRFVRNFATIARPLTNLAKKRQPFIWEDEQQKSFDDLKTALTTPPILGHPNYDLPMEIHCDACDYGIGVVLIQRQDGEERVLD